jgi:hypothetical protein
MTQPIINLRYYPTPSTIAMSGIASRVASRLGFTDHGDKLLDTILAQGFAYILPRRDADDTIRGPYIATLNPTDADL